jgi:hypothetical protein
MAAARPRRVPVPFPIVGVGGLASMIAMMLRVLAIRYEVAWTPRTFGQFSGAVGGGALPWWALRYGLREMLKLIPVLGTVAAGAARARRWRCAGAGGAG